MLGQYSVPFSLAVAAWRDPADPTAFADDPIHDPGILDLAARIVIVPGEAGWGAGLSIALRDGRKPIGHHRSRSAAVRRRRCRSMTSPRNSAA